MKNPSVVVLGSVNMDFIYQVKQLPSPGETIAASHYFQAAGGKGANQAVAAARQGAKVNIIGCIGADDTGQALRSGLQREGISVEHLTIVAASPTGIASIYVDESAQNNIVVVAGANACVTVENVRAASADIGESRCLLCQFETPIESFVAAAKIAHANKTTVILNPSPILAIEQSTFEFVDVLILNELEAKQITNHDEVLLAAKTLLQYGVRHVIITMGSRGVMHSSNDAKAMHRQYSAFTVNAIDSTGAGDTFAGTFAAATAQGMEIEIALQRAQAAAAICVTRRGAQPSIPHSAEVDRLLQQ
jgi:ribokinase